MSRIQFQLTIALALAVLVPSVLFGQQTVAAQQHLAAAAQALSSIGPATPSGDAGKTLAAVRRDFEQMQTALSDPSTSGQDDWRTKYSAIERDLTSLIGSVDTPAGQPATAVANATALDTPTRVALEDFRNHVELFYDAMTGTTSAASASGAQPGSASATPASAATTAGSASQQTAQPPSTVASQPPPTQPPAQAQPPSSTQPPSQTQPPQGTQPPTSPVQPSQPVQPTQGMQPAQPASGAQPSTPVPARQPAVDSEGAAALLDRMEAIVDAALGNRPAGDNNAVGTSGVVPGVDSKSKAGKISVDRAALDEILAEVQQLRTMLRVRQ